MTPADPRGRVMGDDEWDALEHYLRAGAVLPAEVESAETLQQHAAVTPKTEIEDAPA